MVTLADLWISAIAMVYLLIFLVRFNRRKLRKGGLDTAAVYDTRDWTAIESWGHEVAKLALR